MQQVIIWISVDQDMPLGYIELTCWLLINVAPSYLKCLILQAPSCKLYNHEDLYCSNELPGDNLLTFLVLGLQYSRELGQYINHWCSGLWHHQVFSSHGIDYIRLRYEIKSCSSMQKDFSFLHISVFIDDRKCWHIFVFPQNISVCKGLNCIDQCMSSSYFAA